MGFVIRQKTVFQDLKLLLCLILSLTRVLSVNLSALYNDLWVCAKTDNCLACFECFEIMSPPSSRMLNRTSIA